MLKNVGIIRASNVELQFSVDAVGTPEPIDPSLRSRTWNPMI